MRFLREPLTHFLILGGALFALFAIFGKSPDDGADATRIVVAPGLVENLSLSFERNNGRPPTPGELDQVIDEYVREEILSREARKLGLDRDDPVVRKRLRDRVEFLTEDSAGISPPTEAQLGEFLEQNAGAFARPDGSVPELEEVRANVERRWREVQRERVLDEAYAELRKKYTVVVEKKAAP